MIESCRYQLSMWNNEFWYQIHPPGKVPCIIKNYQFFACLQQASHTPFRAVSSFLFPRYLSTRVRSPQITVLFLQYLRPRHLPHIPPLPVSYQRLSLRHLNFRLLAAVSSLPPFHSNFKSAALKPPSQGSLPLDLPKYPSLLHIFLPLLHLRQIVFKAVSSPRPRSGSTLCSKPTAYPWSGQKLTVSAQSPQRPL